MASFLPANNVTTASIAGATAMVVIGLMTDNGIQVSQTTGDAIMVLVTAGVAYLHDILSSMKNDVK